MRGIRIGGLALAALTAGVLAQGASAATLNVTKAGDPAPGACTANDCSLREAVRRANASSGPDRILLKARTYTLTQQGAGEDEALTGDLDVLAGSGRLTIIGKGAGKTTIDGNDLDRILDVLPIASAQVQQLTLIDGNESNGGAIDNLGRLAIRRAALRLNDAIAGGAIHNGGSGRVTVERTLFAGNGAIAGGGLFNESDANARLRRVVFRDNTAESAGGGIYNQNEAVLALEQATIDRNDSGGDGGGIYNQNDARLRVSASTISRNTATDEGGGIYTQNDSLLALVNSTVSGNGADEGGAIYANNWPYIRIAFSTIAKNTAETTGGAIFDQTSGINPLRPPPFWELRGTIVAQNTSPGEDNCALHDDSDPSNHDSQGSNLEDGNTCFFERGSDQRNANAKLRKLAKNGGTTKTHALKPSSDAADAAKKKGCPKRDQRGVKRPQGKSCDVGSYELKRR